MNYSIIDWSDINIKIELSTFCMVDGVTEYHAIIHGSDRNISAKQQFLNVDKALKRLKDPGLFPGSVALFKRFFLSDAANQYSFFEQMHNDCAMSLVQQPPLDGTKVAVWFYFVSEGEKIEENGRYCGFEHSGYNHFFHTQIQNPLKDEVAETAFIFDKYINLLKEHSCVLSSDCIRTWIYVQNVDLHYDGMVVARKKLFEKENLTNQTHYIASTGIEGRSHDAHVLVLMDAYSVKGLNCDQISYLHAPSNLNPTHEYGVTFERGTSVIYGDRRHVFISGTASINNKGEILFEGNVLKQAERAFTNINALLSEADAGFDDVAQMIVYLRDSADMDVVTDYLNIHYPHIPKVLLWAPVCRFGWLIEIECVAISKVNESRFACF